MARIGHESRRSESGRRAPPPLDAARLEALALGYVGRFATTRAKMAAYLARKLRERGWDGDGEPPVAALAERLADAGYIDDAAYAHAKSGALLRRGYGRRRIEQALSAAGIAPGLRAEAAADDAGERGAALGLARRRAFGPFGAAPPDRARREKQVAALLRAGHRIDSARALVNAGTIAAAEAWAEGDA